MLAPGSVFAYGPDSVFSLSAKGETTLVKYFVDFAGAEASSLLASAELPLGKPVQITPVRWVQDLWEQILDCDRYAPEVAGDYAVQLLRVLLQKIRLDRQPYRLPQHSRYQRYQSCRLHICEHFRTLRSIEELSQIYHLDRAYISRLFKQYDEETPYQLLIRTKMEYAAGLLRYHKPSVKAVAAEVGFDDPYHFSRVFKRWYGSSPKQHRDAAGAFDAEIVS